MLFFTQFKKIGLFIIFLLTLYLVNPFSYGHIFGYALVITMLIKKNTFVPLMDKMFLFLLLFSISYALFYALNSTSGAQYIFIYLLFPPMFYILGKRISLVVRANQLFLLLCFLVFLFSVSSLTSVLINIMEGGFVQIERSIPMIWNENLVSATIMGSFLTLNMCIPAILIARPIQFNTISKLLLVILFIASLLCTLRLGSRTQLGITMITSMISIFYVFPRQGIKRNVTLVFVLISSIALLLKYSSINLDSDLLTAFAGRVQDSNNTVANAGGRSERWIKSIEYLFSHPLGWSVHEFGFSHNLWFDALRTSSVIAFALLINVTFKSTQIMIRKLKCQTLLLSTKVHILSYFIGFILIFMVEPILDGMTSLFVLFCLFIGMLNGYNNDMNHTLK